jgi:hypothetical protein
MSTLKTKRAQLGTSATTSNNFTITAESADGKLKFARGNAGATTQDIMTIDSSSNLQLNSSTSSFKDGGGNALSFYPGNKNKIINGNFYYAQRTTAGTTTNSNGYASYDRWYFSTFGATESIASARTAFTYGQTAVPGFPSYYAVNTVTSLAGAGNYARMTQRIENVVASSGQTMTLSFWAQTTTATKNIAVEFVQNFGTGGSPSAEVTSIGVTTVAVTTTWAKYTVTVTFPSVAGKTLGTNGNDFYEVIFWFDAGSSLNGRTNTLGQRSGVYNLSQVQLEFGPAATPYEDISLGDQWIMCQRYYQKTTNGTIRLVGYCNSTTAATYATWLLSTPMRSSPSISDTGALASIIGTVYGGTLGTASTASSTSTPFGFTTLMTGATGFTSGGATGGLMRNTVALSAEL